MTAFSQYYLKEVRFFLERDLSMEEIELAKDCYINGWHPIRTAKRIKTGKDEL